MKIIIFITNIILICFTGYLINMHIKYVPREEDPILKTTPKTHNKQFTLKKEKRENFNHNIIAEKEIFLKNRGTVLEENASSIKKEHPTLELFGTSIFGSYKSAMIIDKRAGRVMRRGRKKRVATPTKVKKYYKESDTMGNGYTLSKIEKNKVTLTRGSDEIILTLDYGDSGSDKRITNINNLKKAENNNKSKEEIKKTDIKQEEKKVDKENNKKSNKKIKERRKQKEKMRNLLKNLNLNKNIKEN